MKKYSTVIAARKLVSERIALGTSRHVQDKKKIDVITSVGTARNHRVALKSAGDWLLSHKGKHLKNLNKEDADEYLKFRASSVGQSAVDLGRQAINFHLLTATPVPYFASSIPREYPDRAYKQGEITLLLSSASNDLNLAIQIAASAGLRAFELITIAPVGFMSESVREAWHPARFLGRERDNSFLVHGKGGLKRQIRLSPGLSEELRKRRRPNPLQICDREVNLLSYFELIGGANFSAQFTNLSNQVLGESNGAHGLRHTFAQKRLRDLLCHGLSYEDALKVLSNELGHFSVNNTLAYLRN